MSEEKRNGHNKKHDCEDKILHFPAQEERARLKHQKDREEKEAEKGRKALEKQEAEWRARYRADQARRLGRTAQMRAGGKQPFINFDRIPLFTRLAVTAFLTIHLGISLFQGPLDKVSLYYALGFTPGSFTGTLPWSPLALASPLTSLFIHGGWMHLAFNTVMMLAMGVFFERQFGFKRTALFFFACGLAGDAFYFLFSPFSTEPVVGASGAISGLFGATLLTMHERKLLGGMAENRGPMPFILIWLVLIIGTGLLSASTAWQAHLGGFLAGLGLYRLRKTGKIRL